MDKKEKEIKDVKLEKENPIGEVKEVPELDIFIEEKVIIWEEANKEMKKDLKWYQEFLKKGTEGFFSACKFLIRSLDELIVIVDDKIDNGADKKATVLNTLSILYDRVVYPVLPLWAKPLNYPVKAIFRVIISSFIDWIVEKYRSNVWKKASL